MKKKLLFVCAFFILTCSIFAGPFGNLASNLNSLNSSDIKAEEGTIPMGKELFPIVYRYVNDVHEKTGKVVDMKVVLDRANVIENEYIISTYLYFKAGIGYQCQKSVIIVNGDGNKFSVLTNSLVNYNVNKKGEQSGDIIDAAKKSYNVNSKNYVSMIESYFSATSDEDYKKWEEAGYSDLLIQCKVGEQSPNRLKAKKWYNSHPLIEKETSINFYFSDIKESKKAGYDYELSGLYANNLEVLVCIYTNNDEYIDTKEGTVLHITGKITDVKYSGEYEKDYKIKSICIEE